MLAKMFPRYLQYIDYHICDYFKCFRSCLYILHVFNVTLAINLSLMMNLSQLLQYVKVSVIALQCLFHEEPDSGYSTQKVIL